MKRIRYIFFTFLCLLLYSTSVWAASMSVTVTSSTVTVGNTMTLKIKGTDLAGKFSIATSNSGVVAVSSNSTWIDNNTVSIKLTAKKAGTAKITVSTVDVTGYDGKAYSATKSISITVKEPVKEVPKVKSSNCYLAGLSIEKYKLDKSFDKEVLEYNVSLDPGVEKIKINAQLADSSAKVTGTGEHEVSVGSNTFQIVVTAENGSKRTYKIVANLKDYDPINVTSNEENYTVIRKKKDLPKVSEYFVPKNVTIGNENVDGYYNESMNYTLVGLIDSNGNSNLFIYDNNEFKLYKEYTFNGITIQYVNKEIDGGVKKVSFKYNDDVIEAYQNVKLDLLKNTYALDNNDIEGNQFYLFYGINLESGKEELYQFDAKEKTVQRFNIKLLDIYKERSDTYYLLLLAAILLLGFNIIIFSIIAICNGKKKKKREKIKNNKSSKNAKNGKNRKNEIDDEDDDDAMATLDD